MRLLMYVLGAADYIVVFLVNLWFRSFILIIPCLKEVPFYIGE